MANKKAPLVRLHGHISKRRLAELKTGTVDEMVRAINIFLGSADRYFNEAQELSERAGEMLAGLRKRIRAEGQDWKSWSVGRFPRSGRELAGLMGDVSRVANTFPDPAPTYRYRDPEKRRAYQRELMRRKRANPATN